MDFDFKDIYVKHNGRTKIAVGRPKGLGAFKKRASKFDKFRKK